MADNEIRLASILCHLSPVFVPSVAGNYSRVIPGRQIGAKRRGQ